MSLTGRIYRGQIDFDFPRANRRVLIASAVLIIVSIGALFVQGLNLSVDFVGGTVWEVPSDTLTQDEALAELAKFDADSGSKVQVATDANDVRIVRVQSDVTDQQESTDITKGLAEAGGLEVTEVETNFVGPTWGRTVTRQAAKAFVIFLILVSIFISARLEWRMAVGAITALIHDVIITVGVYSLFQFDVTPPTVIAILTILGYSLYDTIVVFDRAQENQARYANTGNYTFRQLSRRSLNQVFMRSINTTVTALMPVVAMLVIGALIYGQATLAEFSIALLVGLLTGAYSSIVVATTVLEWLKEREPQFVKIHKRIIDRGGDPNDTRWIEHARRRRAKPGAQASARDGGMATVAATADRAELYERPHPPRPRKKSKR
ncbi:MAG: protein translocase subunit SecF [Microthrixaceae bacterium]|nr:protein translocase subunit SecF [Microthrixaceae bacterium]